MQLDKHDLNIIRQWFDSVQDINPQYLTPADYVLARKIYQVLDWRVPNSISDNIKLSEQPIHEYPYFDNGEWTVSTRHGIVWKIWPDERNQDPTLLEQAIEATQQIIQTGKPLFGGWR